MKAKFILTVAAATALTLSAQAADTIINVTGATAFRTATINSIVAGYGGAANVGIINSVTSGAYTGANAISFRGVWPGIPDNTIIRCRFSGSTEGIRDLVGNGTVPNDVFYYADADIPAVGTVTYRNENANPVTANVAQKPDIAFSDVQQNSSPFRSLTLGPADSRVGVVTFVFLKSQGSSANLTNVTDQAWKATLANTRGVPLNVFTGLSADQSGRVLATGRNDGSGTRAVYLIEPGVGVSRLVNQFKISANNVNGAPATPTASTADDVELLQLWPASDAQDPNNNSTLWNAATTGNGGYFSGSGVTGLLTKDTSSVRILGPTGVDLPSSGSYVGTAAGTPRGVSVVAAVGTGDAVGAIAANNAGTGAGGAGLLSYNGVSITPVPTATDPTGLLPADRYKVTNGIYTLWSYERLFNKGNLSTTQDAVIYGAGTGIVARIPAGLANAGIALTDMVAVRGNDGDTVTQP